MIDLDQDKFSPVLDSCDGEGRNIVIASEQEVIELGRNVIDSES